MNTNRDIKRFWTTENPTDERQTRGLILNTNEVLFNVGDLEDRVSDIEQFLDTVFDGGILKEAFGGTENSQWAKFLKDLSEQLDTAVLTQNDDNSYLFVGNENNSGKFNFSSLWDWIVSKLSSVFSLVKNNETGKVTLTADITGDVTGDVIGNAATATLARRAEKVNISTSTSNANFLLSSIDNDAIANGETPKRTSLKFNEVSKELSSGDKVFASLEDVNSIAAKYITSSAAGAAFADEAALAGDKYYAGQIITTQTTPSLGDNDYCIVLDSGFVHDHAAGRYVYQNGVWTFQYKVSQLTLTQSQLDALNSGITSSDVTKLNGIETGAQVNVQSDWNETDTAADNYISNKPTLASVATSGSYTDLSNQPTIPTVNNGKLTIQKNGTTVRTFKANQSGNATANIIVPTKTSEITNDSDFVTSANALMKSNNLSDLQSTDDAISNLLSNAQTSSIMNDSAKFLIKNAVSAANATGTATIGDLWTYFLTHKVQTATSSQINTSITTTQTITITVSSGYKSLLYWSLSWGGGGRTFTINLTSTETNYHSTVFRFSFKSDAAGGGDSYATLNVHYI